MAVDADSWCEETFNSLAVGFLAQSLAYTAGKILVKGCGEARSIRETGRGWT